VLEGVPPVLGIIIFSAIEGINIPHRDAVVAFVRHLGGGGGAGN
jgi:hypothetical protein